MSTRVIMAGLTLLVVLCGCAGPAIVTQSMPIVEDSHRVLLQQHEIICPLGQGTLFRSYFTVASGPLLRSNRLGTQAVTEWRFALFLPYWHVDSDAILLESDQPVFGSLHRRIIITTPVLTPAGSLTLENGSPMEVVACNLREFLPSHPYLVAYDVLTMLLQWSGVLQVRNE